MNVYFAQKCQQAAAIVLLGSVFFSFLAASAHAWEARVRLAPGGSRTLAPDVVAGDVYGVSVQPSSSILSAEHGVEVVLDFGDAGTISKRLYYGDPDLYIPSKGLTNITLTNLESNGDAMDVRMSLTPIGVDENTIRRIEIEPNDVPENAQRINLNERVFCFADEVDFYNNELKNEAGPDWFVFEVTDPNPRLCFIELDLFAPDVAPFLEIYRRVNDDAEAPELEVYIEGRQPISHSQGNRPENNIFQARTFRPGTYYLRVHGTHPSYTLRTTLLDLPPYDNPSQSIRTGTKFLVNQINAWLTNIPDGAMSPVRTRDPSGDNRESCVSCHTGPPAAKASAIVARAGYPIPDREDLQYVVQRMYNMTRPSPDVHGGMYSSTNDDEVQPTYLFAEALAYFENHISGNQRSNPHMLSRVIASIDPKKQILARDGGNGAPTPGYNFRPAILWNFTEAYGRTGDEYFTRAASEYIEEVLLLEDSYRDTIQLIMQLRALAQVPGEEVRFKITERIDDLWSKQELDGGWKLDIQYFGSEDLTDRASSPAVTALAVETLAQLDQNTNDPRFLKATGWLLKTQGTYGGWFQTKEQGGGRTPFIITQRALQALAAVYPNSSDEFASAIARSSDAIDDLARRFESKDEVTRSDVMVALAYSVQHSEGARQIALKGLADPSPLVRTLAAQALGSGLTGDDHEAVSALARSLYDEIKPVRRAAASAMRRMLYAGGNTAAMTELLGSDRILQRRWALAALRHIASEDPHVTNATIDMLRDPDPIVRANANRVLWRQWRRLDVDHPLRPRIATALLENLGTPEANENVGRIRLANISKMLQNTRFQGNPYVALKKIGRDDANRHFFEAIADVLESDDDQVRLGALSALQYDYEMRDNFMRGEAHPGPNIHQPYTRLIDTAVEHALGDENPEVRFATLQIPLKYYKGNTISVNPMLALLNDSDPAIRELAIARLPDHRVNAWQKGKDVIHKDDITLLSAAIKDHADAALASVLRFISTHERLHASPALQEAILAKTSTAHTRDAQRALIDALGWMQLTSPPNNTAARELFAIVQRGKSEDLGFLSETIQSQNKIVPAMLRLLREEPFNEYWNDQQFLGNLAAVIDSSRVQYSAERQTGWTLAMVGDFNNVMAHVWDQRLARPITEFMVCGPFPNKPGEQFSYPPELAVEIDKSYGTDRGIAKWRRVSSAEDGYLDMLKLYGEEQHNHAVAYLATSIYSLEDQSVSVQHIPFDEGHDIFVNQELVRTVPLRVNNGLSKEPVFYDLHLKKGWNEILIKTRSEIIRPEGSHSLTEPGTRWQHAFEITGGVLGRSAHDSIDESLAPKPEQRQSYSVAYFKDRVMPILTNSEGRDSCISCHQLGGDVESPFELYIEPKNEAELIYNYNRVVDRINILEPTVSKLLLKPLGPDKGLKHKGGELLDASGDEFMALRRWVVAEESTD